MYILTCAPVCICVVWTVFLSAWSNLTSLAIQNTPSEDSNQTAQMCGLIWILAGRTCPKVCFLTLWHLCLLKIFGYKWSSWIETALKLNSSLSLLSYFKNDKTKWCAVKIVIGLYYHIYPKYRNTLNLYCTCSHIRKTPFCYLLMYLKRLLDEFQTVQTLIRCHILLLLILFYTVCSGLSEYLV